MLLYQVDPKLGLGQMSKGWVKTLPQNDTTQIGNVQTQVKTNTGQKGQNE